MTLEKRPGLIGRIRTAGRETVSWARHFGFIAKDTFYYGGQYRSELWRDIPLAALGIVTCVGVVMASPFSIEIKANAPQVPEKVDLSFEITGACVSSHFSKAGIHRDVVIRERTLNQIPNGVIITASSDYSELPLIHKTGPDTRFPPEFPMHFEGRFTRAPVNITIHQSISSDSDEKGRLFASKQFSTCSTGFN